MTVDQTQFCADVADRRPGGCTRRAETLTPLPIVVVVRGVVAALEPCYSGFVIAGEDSAVIEAGEAPRHGVHVTGPSREDHTTQVTYRAPGWAASSACRWVTW